MRSSYQELDYLERRCQLLLGPKIEDDNFKRINVQLETDVKSFMLVASNDMGEQFGEARLVLSDIELTDAEGNILC